MKNILRLFKYIKSQRNILILVFILSIITSAVSAVVPFIFRNIIDNLTRINASTGFNPITISLVVLGVLLAFNQIILFISEKYSATSRIKIVTSLRITVFKHLLDLSVDYIEKHRAGSVLQKVERGINDFTNWLWQVGAWASNLIFETIFVLIILIIKVPTIGLMFAVVMPIMIYISIKKEKTKRPFSKRASKNWEYQAGFLSETVGNLATIKGMSSEKEAVKKFSNYQGNILKNRLVQFKYERWFNFGRDSIGDLAILLSIIYVSVLTYNGKLTPGDIFLIAFYARNLIGSVQPLSRFISDTAEYDITSERLADLLDTKPILKDSKDSKDLIELKSIEFKNVSFEYPNSRKGAISNISFKIDAGKSVALVGPSGTGKSTITKLILRFYEPSNGQILINGEDISNFKQDSIRKNMAIVMQDVALFNTTVKENLAIASDGLSEQEIQKAAKMANADEFIMQLDKGYNTLVGERGIKLSGGQKQRIAITRAILKNPNMIILDEATSALDSESEQLVQDALKKLLYHKMSLIIAHRLSTVRHVDEIIVLKNGRVFERGSHSSLLRKKGLYAKLFNIQSKTGKNEL